MADLSAVSTEELLKALQDHIGEKNKPPAPSNGVMGTLSQAAANLGPSAAKFVGDVVTPILHPIQTAQSIYHLGAGVIQKAIPGEQPDEKYANAVGQALVDRYGSLENVRKTFAEDPVGLMADASAILTGGGGLAARAPGMVGRAGKISARAGAAINPATAIGAGAKAVGKGVSYVAPQVVGGLLTQNRS